MTAYDHEFSQCVVHDEGDSVRLEWTRRGYTRSTVVSDPMVEQFAARENECRALRAERDRLQQALETAERVCEAAVAYIEERGPLADVYASARWWRDR